MATERFPSVSSIDCGVFDSRLLPLNFLICKYSKEVSFSQLHSRVLAIRDALLYRSAISQDLQKEPRPNVVAIACSSSQTAEICAVLAVVLSGGCFAPINESLPEPRLRGVMKDCQAHTIILSPQTPSLQGTADDSKWATPILEASIPRDCVVLKLGTRGELLKPGASEVQKCRPRNDRGHESALRCQSTTSPRKGSEPATTAGGSADVPCGAPEHGLGSVFLGTCSGDRVLSIADRPYQKTLNQESDPQGNVRRSPDKGITIGGAIEFGAVPSDDEDLLYILYTSGTTGEPKGVRGTRSGAINRIQFGWRLCPFRDKDELVVRRTPSFFVDFVAEVFSPLMAGIPLFFPAPGVATDPLRLVPALAEARATRITLTPSLLASILRTATSCAGPLLPDLHTWLVSGEALHPDLALTFRQLTAEGTQLVNLYGTTEVSGDATYCTLDEICQTLQEGGDQSHPVAADVGSVLIGKPLPGVYISIVNPDLLPVPANQPGELLVGGVGIALGYHRRPEETAERFLRSVAQGARQEESMVHIPGLEPGRRVFRTRDRVVQPVAGGALFWLGKLDGEVKVRGVRVSLEEVEMLACKAAGFPVGAFSVAFEPGRATIKRNRSSHGDPKTDGTIAAVASCHPDRGRLVGFFVPNEEQKSQDGLVKLKRQLAVEMTAAQLPAVLMPVLGEFPLTPNGKVDKRALLKVYRHHASEITASPLIHTTGDTKTLILCSGNVSNGASQSAQPLAKAQRAVAQAVVAVLPGTEAALLDWLSKIGGQQSKDSSISELAFADLGGTSLLAVEAAWVVSKNVVQTQAGQVTVPTHLAPLKADDFICNTLEEVALTLKTSFQTKLGAADAVNSAKESSADSAAGRTAPEKPSREFPGRFGDLSLPLPMVTPSTKLVSVRTSSADRKRRFSCEGRTEVKELRQFLSISRAGAGLNHSKACFGVTMASADRERVVIATKVELRVGWSSCLTKCIDATPLVVIPFKARVLSDRQKKGRSKENGNSSDWPHETVYCECLCRPMSKGGQLAFASATGTKEANLGKETLVSSFYTPNHQSGEGTIYIGSHSGEFQAFDLNTGKRKWSFKASGRIESGAACSDDGSTVFFGCHDRKLYAIDCNTGTVAWSFETGDAIKCTPVCVPEITYFDSDEGLKGQKKQATIQGAVLVGSHDGILRSVCQTDGGLLWSVDCGGALFASPAYGSSSHTVYGATTRGRVIAVDCRVVGTLSTETKDAASFVDGRLGSRDIAAKQPLLLWEHQLPAPCFSTPSICSTTGNLVLGCVDGALYCFSSVGDQLWVSREGRKAVFSSPCILPPLSKKVDAEENGIAGPHVIWGCHDGHVRCRSSLDLDWETKIGQGQPVFSSPFFAALPCEGCGLLLPLVFVCSVPGLVAVLNLSNGMIVGQIQLPGEVFSSAVVAGRSLVVGCRDNNLYGIDITSKCSRCGYTY